jgi:hypothetical protein
MAGTFTLTGRFKHNDGVTPWVNSTIHYASSPYPDTTDDTVYYSQDTIVTDANGSFSITLVTETSLFYVMTSDDNLFTPNPFTFAAPTAGSTRDVTDLAVFDPSTITSSIATAAAASAAAAAASAASVNREAANGVAGLDANGLPIRALPIWRALTAVATGATWLSPDGSLIKRITGGTTRATYDATEIALWKTVSTTTGTTEQTSLAKTFVSVNEAPLNPRNPVYGAKNDGVTDDSAAYQAAVNALPGDINQGGGTILVDGKTVWNTPIAVTNKAGVRFKGAGGFTSYIVPGASVPGTGLPLLTFKSTTSIVRGVQLEDLAIDMIDRAAHAIEIQGGFDNCYLSNVWVRGINKAKSGFRIISATTGDGISQSLIADNCQALRTSASTGATAPLWLLDTCHEMTLRLCKAIGGGAADSGQGYKFRNCQLITLEAPSASNVQDSFVITSEASDYSESINIVSPLFETVGRGLVLTGNATNAVYRVKLAGLRNSSMASNVVDATYTKLSEFDSDVLPVLLSTGCQQNRVYALQDSTFTDSSGTALNEIYVRANAAQSFWTINNKLRVGSYLAATPNNASDLTIAVNTAGVGNVGNLRSVSVGAADSGGTGFRMLRVPNT